MLGLIALEFTLLTNSIYSNVDTVIPQLPEYSTLHLGPGIFPTSGNFLMKNGMTLEGEGMGVTILQYPSNVVVSGQRNRLAMVNSQAGVYAHNITLKDFTIDGNYQPGTLITLNGVSLWGSFHTIQRVSLTNLASVSSGNYEEAFGFGIAGIPEVGVSNVIRECVINGYRCNDYNNMSAILMAGVNSNGIIFNNTIIQNGDTNYIFALGYIGTGGLIEGNTVVNCNLGYHADIAGGGTTNTTLVLNTFTNVQCGLFMVNSVNDNVSILFNDVTLSSRLPDQSAFLWFESPGGSYTNLVVFGNTVRVDTQYHNPSMKFIIGRNVNGLNVQFNQVDALLDTFFSDSHNLTVLENVDLDGHPSRFNLNSPPRAPAGLKVIH